MQIPVTVPNLITPCLCKLVLLSHVIVLWQKSLGSQHKVIQSVCTWTGSRTSYSRFILALYLLSCPFYPSAFLYGCIPVLYLVFLYGLASTVAQAGIKSYKYLIWHCIFYSIFIRKFQKLNLKAFFAVSKEHMTRHSILNLAGSIIYLNSKLSNQKDFILRTTNICSSAE